jgi:hypothetical protein
VAHVRTRDPLARTFAAVALGAGRNRHYDSDMSRLKGDVIQYAKLDKFLFGTARASFDKVFSLEGARAPAHHGECFRLEELPVAVIMIAMPARVGLSRTLRERLCAATDLPCSASTRTRGEILC